MAPCIIKNSRDADPVSSWGCSYDQILELEADAGEEDALLTETQLCEAADTETASLEANGRQLPVHTNLVLAVVNGIDFLCSV